MEQEREKNYLYDVVIVGGGSAGLSTAIYMVRARYRILLTEKEKIGGQITITSEIVDYPSVERTSGEELTHSMKEQTRAFRTEFMIAKVLNMDLDQGIKVLHITAGEYKVLGVVLATGADPRKLGFKGEKGFQGRGMVYYATYDGEFFTGMEVFVIGGGFAAAEKDVFLTRYAREVTLAVRRDDSTYARTAADQVEKGDKAEVKFNTEILEAGGEHMVSYARFRNNRIGEGWTHEADENGGFGIFVFAGYVPSTAWISGKLAYDEQDCLATDSSQGTSAEGVHGVRDVYIRNLHQVVITVSDDAAVVAFLEKHVSSIHEKLGIPALEWGEADTKRLEEEMTGGGRTLGEGSRGDGARGEDIRGENTRAEGGNGSLSAQARQQLSGLFPKFQEKAVIIAKLDDSLLAGEMNGFPGELEGLADRIIYKREYINRGEKKRREADDELFPTFRLGRQDGRGGNTPFHGVPRGHEFNFFIMALYNMAGPGQPLDEGLRQRLSFISKDINVKMIVSPSCTTYPEVAMAVQGVASLSEYVTAGMIDLMYYLDLKKKYNIMNVPYMVINGSQVYLGKKSLEEVTGLLKGS